MTTAANTLPGANKKWWCLVLVSALSLLYLNARGYFSVAADAPSTQSSRSSRVTEFHELAVPADFTSFHVPSGDHHFRINLTKNWSGKVFIPPGCTYVIKAVDAELMFCDGSKETVRSGESGDCGQNIKYGIFQLRGTGYADVWVQRRTGR